MILYILALNHIFTIKTKMKMSDKFEVINIPDYLNVRETPTSSTNLNIIGRLNNGDIVEGFPSDIDSDKWGRFKRETDGGTMVGYIAKRFLKKLTSLPKKRSSDTLSEVHMTENLSHIDRDNKLGRAFPIGEKDRPKRKKTSNATKIESLHKIVDWLDVEKSARYGPESTKTFCNIYAYDYAYLAGVFVPRVWWMSTSISKLMQSKIRGGKNESVDISYGQTIFEMNANNIHIWFEEFGDLFGWTRYFDVTEFQNEVNKGKVGIITARQMDVNRSGHIVPVVPENDTHKAQRDPNGKVLFPLQSQAGRTNRKYFTDVNHAKWWTMKNYIDFGFWLHD